MHVPVSDILPLRQKNSTRSIRLHFNSQKRSLIRDETARQEELQNYQSYTQSQEYVEDIAKSKLGLAYDNEIIFKEEP